MSVSSNSFVDALWNVVVYFQPPSVLITIGEVWVPVMHFCVWPIHCKACWRVSRRLGSCRLISVHLWSGQASGNFLLALFYEGLCCLHSSYQIYRRMLWWTVVGVNWSTSCQECHRTVFWAHHCSSCTPQNFFSILENQLIGYVDGSTLIAIVPSPDVRVTVAVSELWPHQG